jgi:hypothetical protein
MIGKEICQAILFYLNSDRSLKLINDTNIVLIPKKKVSAMVTNLRHISLCTVIYKMVAKVLANQLKCVLPHNISPNQSAFVAGRHITNIVIAAYEIMHTIKTRMKGKTSFMVLKLDISKAYDRVEWSFLEGVMSRLGFLSRWVSLIMKCISTVSYSILISGSPNGMVLLPHHVVLDKVTPYSPTYSLCVWRLYNAPKISLG